MVGAIFMSAWVVIGILVAFALLAWWAKHEALLAQTRKDDIEDLGRSAELVEKSNASAETAASRSDPRVHDAPDGVPGTRFPEWSRRD